METVIINAIIISCTISALFVATRVYFCYFAKPKKCSRDCSCEALKDARLEAMYCDEVTEETDKENVSVKENPKRPGAYKRPRN